MNTDNINQALAQMETCLKELDSARKQVEKVTESSSNLTSATSSLVQEVKFIADKIGNETSAIISKFSEKLSDFDRKLNISTDAAQKNIETEVEKFRESTINLKSTAENAIDEIKSLTTDAIKTQETEISKTINSISSYCIQVQNLIEKLSDLEFNNQFNKLDANIINIHNAIRNIQNQIGNVEISIGDKLIESSDKQTSTLSNFQEKLNQTINALAIEMNASSKRQQTNTYITWIIIVLGVLSIFLGLK